MLECLESAVVNLPADMPHQSHFDKWLNSGFNANMKWMERNAKFDNKGYNAAWIALWKYPKPIAKEHEPIAAYAHGTDYHIIIKKTLREMAEKINGYPFVDSSPVPERELAALAGLGFIGKNTMLINPKFGSAFFIGGYLFNNELFISPKPALASSCSASFGQPFGLAELQRTSLRLFKSCKSLNPENRGSDIFSHCSNCRKCIDACPNHALTEDGFLNANKCASYLTIEYRGDFSEEQKEYAKHVIFGCDICQQVCPYNKKHLTSQVISISTDFTKSKIKNTPMFRTGVKNLKRNVENFLENY